MSGAVKPAEERTYTKADLEASRAAWSDFGEEWTEAHKVATGRGMLYPPTGSGWDDREDVAPSQRAIVWQALEYRPRSTLAIIGRSSSWSQVVRAILAEEGRLREAAGLAEQDAAWDKDGQPGKGEATERLRAVLGRLA